MATVLSGLKMPTKNLFKEMIAGLIAAIAAIPDGMASATLAGVNPVYGLYNLMVGTPVAALFTSSVYMAVITTSAMALVVLEALAGFSGDDQLKALVTLTILVGLFQLSLALLKLGYLTRFVSNSVMRGFLTGIGIVIILSQLPDFTGYAAEGSNKVTQTLDLLGNLGQVDLFTLGVGILTIVIIVLLDRTRLKALSMLIALIAGTLLVNLLNWESVVLVGDTAVIPDTLPRPVLPQLTLVPQLLIPAIAIGIIGLVQATGVSQAYPNPDGKYPDPDGDFRGQGLANAAAGFFQGLPVGGSVSGTTLVVGAGAQSRWANIFTGLFVALGVLLFAGLIEILPMACLAGILIYAGYQSIKPADIRQVWQTNAVARFTMLLTLVATLFLPVQQAIILGVVIQIFIYIFQAAERMTIMELVPTPDGDFQEQPASTQLPGHQVTILLPYGSLFFAAARDFEDEAPTADDTSQAAVVIILRGRQKLGSTAIGVFERYAQTLQQNGGRLFLADVSEPVRAQLERTGTLAVIGEENIIPANDRLIASTKAAYDIAEAWLND
jgi:SulP family sulfate permease